MRIYSWAFFMVTGGLAMAADFSWQKTDSSLALRQGDRTVWQHNYAKGEGKPYFHPLTIAGSDSLSDFRPADHFWHKAVWFSWKTINGVLYWEEDPKTGKSPGETDVMEVKVSARDNHSARFEMTLDYRPAGKPAVMTERRIIEMSPPTATGAYRMDWTSTFTAGETEVVLDRTPIVGEPEGVPWGGYAGLSLRLAPALKKWQYIDAEGVVTNLWKPARWIAFSGPLPDGKPGTILVLDHPKNPRHPTPWYLIRDMPYFSPAFLYQAPYKLAPRGSFTLKYQMGFQPGSLDRTQAEAAWRKFAETP